MTARFLALPFLYLVSACSASGPVGSYECARDFGRTDKLELTADGKAIWLMGPKEDRRDDFRYEENKGVIHIIHNRPPRAEPVDALQAWRDKAEANRPTWKFMLKDGNLVNQIREGEDCTRS